MSTAREWGHVMVVLPLVAPKIPPVCSEAAQTLCSSGPLTLVPGYPLQPNWALKVSSCSEIKQDARRQREGPRAGMPVGWSLRGYNICCLTNPLPTNAQVCSRGLCI